MKILRWVPFHNLPPRGYGLVYRDYGKHAALMAPIPLNLILRLAYAVHLWLVVPWRGLDDPREVHVIHRGCWNCRNPYAQ